MEEPKTAETTPPQTTNPPSTAQTLPPQPPQPPSSLPPSDKKRPLDSPPIQDSNYFKMRAVLKDLRPHFLEVLRTPDFRNCKAAHEIREQMKLMVDLYKEMTVERVSIGKCTNVPGGQPLSGENQDGQKPQDRSQDVKLPEQPLPGRVILKPPEDKHLPSGNMSERQHPEDGRNQGAYVVGGSAFGWNFITVPGDKPVYYGVTKESFRNKT